ALSFSLRLPPRSTLFPYTTLFRSQVRRSEAEQCGALLEGELQRGRSGQVQLVVLLAAAHAVGGVPVPVQDDLELVVAGGQLEGGGVAAGVLPRLQGGGGAVGLPVLGATELVLERAGQHHGVRRRRSVRGQGGVRGGQAGAE